MKGSTIDIQKKFYLREIIRLFPDNIKIKRLSKMKLTYKVLYEKDLDVSTNIVKIKSDNYIPKKLRFCWNLKTQFGVTVLHTGKIV